jgi:hypothetical protein
MPDYQMRKRTRCGRLPIRLQAYWCRLSGGQHRDATPDPYVSGALENEGTGLGAGQANGKGPNPADALNRVGTPLIGPKFRPGPGAAASGFDATGHPAQCISSTDVSALWIIDCVQLPNNISCTRERP